MKVCVVGAANIDLISYVPRLPQVGETLHGTQFRMGYGGKGANQAVMAARLRAEVTMVCKLGRDVFGEGTLENFRAHGVDTTHVTFTEDAFSGVAPIAVDPDGRNAIIIVTGANDLLSLDDLERARPAIAAADVVVCQLELPVETTLSALRIAREEGVRTIFNPAPARDDLPDELFRLSDVICPNEPETELLTGMPAGEGAARELLARGVGAVALTLGDQGCLLVEGDSVTEVPVEPVRAVDTTGAGDAFVGALATFLAAGRSPVDAAERSNAVAALSVQGRGTQTSFPSADDLPAALLG
ncbi:MAG TPA: ribokinase [Gaiellaceae bacterium]